MHLLFLALRTAMVAFVVLLAGTVMGPGPVSAATTRTWTGAVNTNWNNAGNWNPAGVPATGDQLVFPGPASTVNNDIAGLDVASLTLQAGYTITGNGFTVDQTLALTAGAATITPILTAGGSLSVTASAGANLTLAGGLNLAGSSMTIGGAGNVVVTGGLSAGGSVTKTGTGTLEYHGIAGYGATFVNAGTLLIANDIANPCGPASSGRLPATGVVTVAAGALLDLQCSVTIGGLAGGGEVRTESAAVVLTIAANADTTFSGAITGPGALSVTGSGFVAYGPTLTGVSTYTGPTTVSGGGIGFAGGSIATSSSLVVSGQGVVGGTGTLPASTVMAGLIFPGIFDQPGRLAVPSLGLTVGAVARFLLADPSRYDTIAVAGGVVNLAGASLELRTIFGQDPLVGSKFAIITGASGVLGTFAGLPEGAIFFRNGLRYAITYQGGTGHDVIVTRLTAPPADLSITKTASNASMTPGGTLTFTIVVSNAGPEDAPKPTVTDTLAPALLFQSITTSSGWACNTPTVGQAGPISCGADTIAKNTQATLILVVKVAAGTSGDVVNAAAVMSGAADTATVNNSASVTVRIAVNARPYALIAPNVANDGTY